MKKSCILFLFMFILAFHPVFSQTQAAYDAVQKDYPNLYKMYGVKSLEKQKAHYIFAIDVSTFMRTNLEVIKPLIKEFIKALPDGDQVTLIRKSSTDNTDYVGNIKNLEINDHTRNVVLPNIIDGDAFAIQDAGSDGFAMTDKILKAIMDPMSEGLVFVFMFTDFEYWTAQNGYDKSKENWKSLKDKFQPFLDLTNRDQSRVIFPYAFYYRDTEYREKADYKDELKDIFGSLNQPPMGDASVLRSFFTSLEANALVYRLKYKIFQSLTNIDMASHLELTKDGQIMANVSSSGMDDFPLYSEFDYEITQEPKCLNKTFLRNPDTRHALEEPFVMYELNKDYNPILPRFAHLHGSVRFNIKPLCDKYTKELDMLNGLDESLKLVYNKTFAFEEDLPSKSYFFHILPGWLDILILALIAAWLIALLVTFLINKFGNIHRSWNIMATVDDEQNTDNFSHVFPKTALVTLTPQSLGILNGDNWRFDIITVDGPIYSFWKPRGYYIKRGIANVTIERKGKKKALPQGAYRVAPLKKWGAGCSLTFTVNGNNYTIKIR